MRSIVAKDILQQIKGESTMILTVGAVVKDDQGKQYILDEVLGSGGFGCVFKAHRDDGTIYVNAELN